MTSEPDPQAADDFDALFFEQQEIIRLLTGALRGANTDVERLRSGIQAIIDDAWLTRTDDVMDTLRELLA